MMRPLLNSLTACPNPKSVVTAKDEELSNKRMSRRWLCVLILIILVGAAIRIGTMVHEDLWSDELFSLRIALLPVHPALSAIEKDVMHPPLYYFLLKAGIAIWGASPLGIRLVSLFSGLGTIVLAAIIGKNLLGAPNCGLLAAAMFALNQNLVIYSQEARSYSLYTFLTMLVVLWASGVASNRRANHLRSWIAGCLLMVALVYTEYMGALYIASALAALLICNVPRRTKALALSSAIVAALCFVPWILAVEQVYRSEHGLNQILGWVLPPRLIDLVHSRASAIGILDVRGGAAIALLLVAVLTASALLLRSRGKRLRDSLVLVMLVLYASLPPALLFFLSQDPPNLHLFVLRQLLPSDAALCIICCYGVENLARRFRSRYTLVFAAGSAIALIAAAAPTVQCFAFGPYRLPFHIVARDLKLQQSAGWEIYAGRGVGFYIIGESTNFYCETTCVRELPEDPIALPKTFIYLYDSRDPAETIGYRNLLNEGFEVAHSAHYVGGDHCPFEVSMVYLKRVSRE